MLPAVVATELRESVRHFLRATFPMTTAGFRRIDGGTPLEDLLADPRALFKGPYLSLGLPFRTADPEAPSPFEYVPLGFLPFRHQARAFERLSGVLPRSTLVATGTGSGKTESFLYPLLEDAAARSAPGVKAIVIYPMNALARDQAGRIAEKIHEGEALRGRVSVGLFTGDRESTPTTGMSAQAVITDHDILRRNPPDILLTNYKMLDFLLMRPRDQAIWRFNEPDTLRYLVVDELHTFDGAQGTDLACLIRRLRDRLAPDDKLACVGTSATIGGAQAAGRLRDYAEEVFATPFDEDAVLLEERLSPDEYLEAEGRRETTEHSRWRWPARSELPRMRPRNPGTSEEWLRRQAEIWLDRSLELDSPDPTVRDDARVELGRELVAHQGFAELLDRGEQGPVDLNDIAEDWAQRFGLEGPEPAQTMLDSLLALVSAARRRIDEKRLAPLVEVRVQLWLRELRRMVASVAPEPALDFADSLSDQRSGLHLPVVHCRECHATGWASVKRPDEGRLEEDLRAIYNAWFGNHPDACLMFPLEDQPPRTASQGTAGFVGWVCPEEGQLRPGRSAETGGSDGSPCESDAGVRVWQPDMTRERSRREHKVRVSHHDCPFCGAADGLSLLGARAASLSSVVIGQLYHSLHNEHRKLIAFSDSVQDAAHRAGFFEARTYTTLVRRAIAQFVNDRGRDLDLAMVAREMPRYWRRALGDDARFVGTFIAPNMVWLRDYEQLVAMDALAPGSDLPELVSQRLEWEVMQGFGLRARIGRTLERGRIATVGVNIEDELLPSARTLADRLSEEIGPLRDVGVQKVQAFLQGLLWRGRTRGGFYHPFLDEYIQARGKTYKPFNLSLFLPNYGGAARPPALWTLGRVGKSFDDLHGESGSWFRAWFDRVLATDEHVLASAEFRQVMSLTVDVLRRDGWLLERPVGDQAVFGLDPQRWYAGIQVKSLHCGVCGHPVEVLDNEYRHWLGVPCLRSTCEGHYEQPVRPSEQDALQEGQGAPTRLVTAEHTALLDSDGRAAIEGSFKRDDPLPWDVNLLSATPTLEMGIDIGDLSSVLLCSVPPSQSNYLQRVGRSGRRDGNSLAVTVANGVGHDNYFFDDPLKMLAGLVEPPGVFLNAAAVLERQLMAFCLDRWAASGIAKDAIPGRMQIVLDAIERDDTRRFPHDWLEYVANHRRPIMEGFTALFPGLEDATRASLHRYLFGAADDKQPGMDWRLLNRLRETAQRRRKWTQRIDRLKREIGNLESGPEDDKVRERLAGARGEREALMSLRRHLNHQHTLNFLTDEGLIPNYAFPEEGVTLQSIILRRTRSGSGAGDGEADRPRMERLNFQMQRSAEAALAELAPLNRFYSQGRAVEIDQVDLAADSVQQWRFCDNCQYVENLETSGDPHSVCPRCGSAQWADAEQRRSVLRMRQVYATADDRESRIGDDADDRQPAFYTRQMLVDIDPAQPRRAWRLATEDLPFAFEYIPQVTLREINFGQLGVEEAEFRVAGDLNARPGFRICRHCGKVRRPGGPAPRPGQFPHAYDCSLARPGAEESEEDYHSSLYLFRELHSEAIRILLPLADFAESEVRLHSLIAALNLGLREYFRGSVDHLRVTDYTAPGEGQGSRRHYLVLYDSVPGGTGYLKQLLKDTDPLLEVLRRAWEVVRTCKCREEEDRDGCYACVLAWRDRYRMPTISRAAAEDLLGRMLEHADTLEPIDGVEEVHLNSLVESELEQRFLDALCNAHAGVRASQELVNGKPGYFLTLQPPGQDPGTSASTRAWKLELQRNLGTADGVRVPCKPDFVLWPVRAGDGQKPVAVFVDGFSVHFDQLADDTAKRQATLDSGRFHVWSLGWNDLPQSGKEPTRAGVELLESAQLPDMVTRYNALTASNGDRPHGEFRSGLEEGGFRWLIQYLQGGDEALEWLREAAFSRAFCMLDQRTARDAGLRQAVAEALEIRVPSWGAERVVGPSGGDVFAMGGALPALSGHDGVAGMVAGLPVATFQKDTQALRETLAVALFIDDRDPTTDKPFEMAWRAFWNLSNLLQFAPRFSLSTALGVEGERYAPAPVEDTGDTVEAAEPASGSGEGPCWAELRKLSLFGDAVADLQKAGVPCPDSGYELQNEAGAIVAELELAWPDARTGLLVDPDPPTQEALQARGWIVWVGLDEETIQAVANQVMQEA